MPYALNRSLLLPACTAVLTLSLLSPAVFAAPVSAEKPKPASATRKKSAAKKAAPLSLAQLQQQAATLRRQAKTAEEKLKALRGRLRTLVNARRKLQGEQSVAKRRQKRAADTLKKQQAAVKTAAANKQKADAALAAAQKAKKPAKVIAAAQKKAADAAKALQSAEAAVKKTQAEQSAAAAVIQRTAGELKKVDAQIAALRPPVLKQQEQFARLNTAALETEKRIESLLIQQGKLVSFSEQVAPIFVQRCLACHNARTAKGRFNMETFAALMKGGESGPAIDSEDPELSNLLSMVEDGSMPKEADPLTKPQIALIRRWIQTGAKLNAGIAPTAPLASIVPKRPQPPAPKSYRVPLPVTAVAFSPDGKLLASSGYHEVILWNPQNGQILRRITNVAERVYDLAFSPDGSRLAVAAGTPGQLGEAKIFRVSDGTLLADLAPSNDSVFTVAFSADGQRLAAAGADRAIRVYDVPSGQRLVLIEDHADWVMGVAFSPDGKKLASASRDKTSKVFDLSPVMVDPTQKALGNVPKNSLSGESLVTFNGHGQPVYDVAFSPDGKAVITCGGDKQIRIWNPANAKPVRNIGGFGGDVFHLQVTQDGRIISCSADKTARIHLLANGKAVKTFSGHADWVYSVSYSPKTKQVATGSYNGEIRLFNETDGKLIRRFIAAPGYKPLTSAKK